MFVKFINGFCIFSVNFLFKHLAVKQNIICQDKSTIT